MVDRLHPLDRIAHERGNAMQTHTTTTTKTNKTKSDGGEHVPLTTKLGELPGAIEMRLARAVPSKEIASTPLLGVLPLARVVPQDVHTLIDLRNAIGGFVTTFIARDDAARFASAALGGSILGVSMLTDCRLSVAKVIPIEAHEAFDYVWGAAAIAAPFVFGYWKKQRRLAMAHVMLGVTTLVVSLFTDYRAARGRALRQR
jgi:hypothetical protein